MVARGSTVDSWGGGHDQRASASPQSAAGFGLSTPCPWEVQWVQVPGALGKCGSSGDYTTRHRLETTADRPFGSTTMPPVFMAYGADTSGLIVDSVWMPMYESIQRSKNHKQESLRSSFVRALSRDNAVNKLLLD